MKTGKIKSDLIAAIKSTGDPLLLLELSKLMDIGLPDDSIINLSDKQVKQLMNSIAQIENGEGVSHTVANEQSEEWLKE